MMWPFRPDWSDAYRETWAFLTVIITSDSGKEQRISLRLDPRRTLDYQVTTFPARFEELRRTLARQSEPVTFADELRTVVLSSAAESGSATATIEAAPAWLVAGTALLFRPTSNSEPISRVVTDVTGLIVTFSAPADAAWPDGSVGHLSLTGRLADSLRARMRTNEVAQLPATLDVEPGTEIDLAGAAGTLFNGREVFDHQPNWAESLEVEFTDTTEYIDPGMGIRAAFRNILFGTEIRRSSHLIRSASDLNRTLGMFLRARGRQGEMYLPSGLNDISLKSPVASGAVFWFTAGHGLHTAYGDDTVHRAIAITLTSGAVIYLSLVGLTAGGTTDPWSRIETVEAAPYDIDPADVVMISWMPVVRFVSDEVSIDWRTNTVGEMTVNLQTLEDLP
jgi:hypothetical protein